MTSPSNQRSLPFNQLIVLALLLILFLFGAAPGYLKGKWAWQTPPINQSLGQMRQIPRLGVTIPGWETTDHQQIQLGGKTWSSQTIVAQENSGTEPGSELILMVHPQLDPRDMPKVEWTDIQAAFRWTEDEVSHPKITPEMATPEMLHGEASPIQARFFRGWKENATEGLLEWYALPGEGSYKPGSWFWRDRTAQLKGQRTPWMAVVLRYPIAPLPLEPLEPSRDTLSAAAPRIQAAIEQVFATPS